MHNNFIMQFIAKKGKENKINYTLKLKTGGIQIDWQQQQIISSLSCKSRELQMIPIFTAICGHGPSTWMDDTAPLLLINWSHFQKYR